VEITRFVARFDFALVIPWHIVDRCLPWQIELNFCAVPNVFYLRSDVRAPSIYIYSTALENFKTFLLYAHNHVEPLKSTIKSSKFNYDYVLHGGVIIIHY
jgi:hypothetical protein